MRKTTMIIFGAIILLLQITGNAQAQYYKGKTINMIIPVPGGSGLDLIGRTFAPYLSKHIPGNPTIVARNLPGAGGTKALNFTYDKGKPDGLTFIFGPWSAAAVISKQPGIRYDPSKFEFIGASATPQTTLMRTDVKPGLKTAADIVKAETFNIAGRNATRELDLQGNLALDIIGARYNYVPGFRGMAKINPSMRSNETQAGHSGYTGYTKFFRDTMVKDGQAIALWYHSDFDSKGNPITNPNVTEFEAFHEVYKKVHGKLPSGPKWEAYKWMRINVAPMTLTIFMPPKTDKEAVAIMRAAYEKMKTDKVLTAELLKVMGIAPTYLSLEQGLNVIKTYREVTPEILAVLNEMGQKGGRTAPKKRKKVNEAK